MSDPTLSEQLRQVEEVLNFYARGFNWEYIDEQQDYWLPVEQGGKAEAALALTPSIIERVEALEEENAELREALAEAVGNNQRRPPCNRTGMPLAELALTRHAVARENAAAAGSTVGGVG